LRTRRQLQVAEQIHRELSTLLMFEARDPRLSSITITDVDITPDLLIAHVYFTLLGTEEDKQATMAGLEHARGYLRTQVAERIQQRLAPELVFRFDRSAEEGERIDRILDRLKKDSPSSGAEDGNRPDGEPG
jgi:ribosome-binding factor A